MSPEKAKAYGQVTFWDDLSALGVSYTPAKYPGLSATTQRVRFHSCERTWRQRIQVSISTKTSRQLCKNLRLPIKPTVRPVVGTKAPSKARPDFASRPACRCVVEGTKLVLAEVPFSLCKFPGFPKSELIVEILYHNSSRVPSPERCSSLPASEGSSVRGASSTHIAYSQFQNRLYTPVHW